MIVALALRWRIFLKQQDIQLPFKTIFSLTWAGQFYNSILPGSTGGDLVKIYQVCRFAPQQKAAGLSSVLVDRLSALVALLILAAAALWLDPHSFRFLPSPAFSPRKLIAAGILLLAGVGIAFLILTRLCHGIFQDRIAQTFAALKRNLVLDRPLFAALLLAFGIHLWNFFTIYLFARALHISITYGQVLLMMPVVLLVMLVPITINGHGLRELLFIGYFSYLGIAVDGSTESNFQSAALALSLVAVTNDLLWAIPGGLRPGARFRLSKSAPLSSGANGLRENSTWLPR